ncbi:MAG: transglycosylase family protein [Acidimicrobiales bacterium]
MLAVVASPLSDVVTPRADAAGATVGDKQAEAARLSNDLAAQAQRVIDADKRFRASQAAIADVQESLRQAEIGVRTATLQQDEARRRLASHAVDAYTRGGSVSVLGKRLRASSDLAVYDTYLSLVAGMDRSAIEGLRGAREDLDEREASFATALKRAKEEAGRAATEHSSLQAAQEAQRANLGRVNGELTSLVAAEQARRQAEAAAARPAPASTPTAASAAAPASRAAPSGGGPAPATPSPSAQGDAWECIRQLESGGNYSDPGGGAYQFVDSTWQSLGYSGAAEDHPPAVQDAGAQELQAREGWGPWPNTARMCGLL